jgi:murein DD-endopeptidase MepM/ murein hydrolase activator NlpD
VPVKRRVLSLVVLGVSLLALGPGTGSSAQVRNLATSQAFAIRITIPGLAPVTTGYVAAPNDSSGASGGFAYPADGSVLTSGAITSNASAIGSATTVLASAATQINSVSLFGGEVTIGLVDAKVKASAGSDGGAGDFTGTGASGIGGSAYAEGALGTWGTLSTSSGFGESSEDGGAHGWHGSVTAVTISLTADHGGLPAGSQIQIGYAAVNVSADAIATTPATTTTQPTTTAPTTTGKKPKNEAKKRPKRGEKLEAGPPPIGKVPTVQPQLTAGRYVFPVYGDAAYSDTFGAPRADVTWHHGADIFAPLGAPVLAVADGTVFSVGWNKAGGWRLWLRDRDGNEFYYAHLSAYSPYALNRAQVRAGTVLGFIGNTGDAEGTPYHLHFEIHPVALLGLGYDGAVNPTPYLDAWRRLQDIRFGTGGAWLPGLVRLTPSRAPEPGAILLQITDISSASGLEPGSLRRALRAVGDESGVALAGGSAPPASAGSGDLGRG